jgi:sugar/nucleoside kinase (ribokinase family)
LFCSQADAKRLFNRSGSIQEIAQGMLELTMARFVVVTFGAQGALLWNGKDWQHQPSQAIQIVDRLSASDALALTQFGDMVLTNRSELLRLSQGGSLLTR